MSATTQMGLFNSLDEATGRTPLIRIFYSLRYRDYAIFWSMDLFGSIGHFVQEVALYWIAYEITGSAMALGILGLCGALPRLIFGALGGVLVDRYDRKRLLVLIQFFSALPVFIFLSLYAFGTLEFWHLLCSEILFGSIRAINPSAAQSIISELVPRADLLNAVSLYTVGFNLARIMGPSFRRCFGAVDRHRWLLCRLCSKPRCFRNRNDADSVKRTKSG